MPRAALVLLAVACSQPQVKPAARVGTGEFTALATLELASPTADLAAGDFDGDGVPTLVAVTPGLGRGKLFELRDERWKTETLAENAAITPLIPLDVDGDSIPELVVGGDEALKQLPGGEWKPVRTWSAPIGARGSAAGELTSAPGVELVVSGLTGELIEQHDARLMVLEPRDGNFASLATLALSSRTRCETPVIVDFDGDGSREIVCPSGLGGVEVVERPDGGFAEPIVVTSSTSAGDRGVACDLDGDGRQEVIMASSLFGTSVLSRLPDGRLDLRVLLAGLQSCSDLQCGDFDSDGAVELAAVCDDALRIFQAGANGIVTSSKIDIRGTGRLLHADVTGDGVADLVVNDVGVGALRVFRAVTRER